MSLRTTLLALAFAASCAATPPLQAPSVTPPKTAPVPQAANDSEAQYRKMEAAVTSAKTLQVTFESAGDGVSAKGSFKIGEGNKLEMKVEGVAGVKKYTLTLTCDGKQMTLVREETPPPPVPLKPQAEFEPPPNLAANTAAGFARGGAWLAQEFSDGEYRAIANAYYTERQKALEENNRPMKPQVVPPGDLGAMYELKNFRSGGAGAVTYDLFRKGENSPVIMTFTVTIDPKTSLPSRREGAFAIATDGKPGAPVSKWTEKYSFK
jgi:hypothetical protein